MEQRKRAVQKKHIAGLDGLRGIATVAIVLYHMFPQQVRGGFLGVSLFFVLSGYLMAITSARMIHDGEFHVFSFYRKRILKIYPALIIVVGLTVIVLKLFIKIPLNNIRGEVLSIMGGYNNWWQIRQNTSYFTKVNGTSGFIHLWSLAVEMQFYIIWPFLLYIYIQITQKAGKKRSIQFLLILSFISLISGIVRYRPGEDATRIYYGTDTRIYAMLFGSVLGFMGIKPIQRMKKKTVRQLGAVFAFCILIIFALFLIADGQSAFTYWIVFPISCFLFLIIVYIAANPMLPFGNLLDATPLAWIGKYSYEIYLCQYPVSFVYKIMNKGKYTFGQIITELLIVFLISLLLHNSIIIGQRRIEQKRYLRIVGVSVFLLIGMGFIFPSEKLTENADQEKFREELEANAELLNTQNEDAHQEDIKDGIMGRENKEECEVTSADSILLIGDSVMLGAGMEIQNAIPNSIVEAAESRQMWDASEIVKDLKNKECLSDCVVVGLGANGPFSEQDGQELIDAIGKECKIYLITAYGQYLTWQESVNEKIWKLAEDNGNVTVIDWAGFAAGHSEWFYDDGMHLNHDGQIAYADFLKKNIVD